MLPFTSFMNLKSASKLNFHSCHFGFTTSLQGIGSVYASKFGSQLYLVENGADDFFSTIICFAKMLTQIELLFQSSVEVKQPSRYGGKTTRALVLISVTNLVSKC